MDSVKLLQTVSTLSAASSLSIHKLSSPLLASESTTRSSTSSNPGLVQTPEDLRAELTHYKDLFSKLRFSYTEQVTKERFLRALVASPPDLVDAHEIEQLEQKLGDDKAALKQKKEIARETLSALEIRAAAVAQHSILQTEDVSTLSELPQELESLSSRVKKLRSLRPETNPDPLMNMSLDRTTEMLEQRTQESSDLAAQIAEMTALLQARKQDVARLEGEFQNAEQRKREAIAEVQDLKRRRGSGQIDQLELRGRWSRAAADVLRATAA